MSGLEWRLRPPQDLAPTRSWEAFVSEAVDWEHDYAAQVIVACEYLELCGYSFVVHGFGRSAWPVTVGYDLSSVLEDMPGQLRAVESGRPARIDMYAPGTEIAIDVLPSGDDVVLRCTTALWTPDPDTIVMARADFVRTVRRVLADFSAALRDVGSPLAGVEPFLGWGHDGR